MATTTVIIFVIVLGPQRSNLSVHLSVCLHVCKLLILLQLLLNTKYCLYIWYTYSLSHVLSDDMTFEPEVFATMTLKPWITTSGAMVFHKHGCHESVSVCVAQSHTTMS